MMNELMPTHPSSRVALARQVALGIIVGCAVTSVPWLVSKLNNDKFWPFNFLWLPGLTAAIALGGNMHTYNFTLALSVNVIFYASLVFLLLRIRKKKA